MTYRSNFEFSHSHYQPSAVKFSLSLKLGLLVLTLLAIMVGVLLGYLVF